MSDTDRPDAARSRPHTPPAVGPFLEHDLMNAIDELRREPAWQTGRNARTLVKYADFRVVLTVLKAGERTQEHAVQARISVQALAGHIRVGAAGHTFDLHPGRLLALDRGVTHAVEAVEESAFLLTIAWHAGAGGEG